MVPDGVQGYDRYAYVNNDPVRYSDPSGHMAWMGDGGCTDPVDCGTWQPPKPIAPIWAPNGGRLQNEGQQSFGGISWDAIADACKGMVGNGNPLCDAGTYTDPFRNPYGNNITIAMPPLLSSDQVASGLDLVSIGLSGTNDALHWTPKYLHIPLISIAIDAGSQYADDRGKGYTPLEETSRVLFHVGEGQLSGWAGVTLAGADSIPGAVTGPGDVIIIGGSYVIGSAATSFWLNQVNGVLLTIGPQRQTIFLIRLCLTT